MLISKLVSDSNIRELAKSGHIASLDGRCIGKTLAAAFSLIGDAMHSINSPLHRRCSNIATAINLEKTVRGVITKLSLKHLTVERRDEELILIYDIFYKTPELFQIVAGAEDIPATTVEEESSKTPFCQCIHWDSGYCYKPSSPHNGCIGSKSCSMYAPVATSSL